MSVYHERLYVPSSWWLLGLVIVLVLGAEFAVGFGWLVAVAVYLVLGAGYAAMLTSWGRARIEIASGEIKAGREQMPLAEVGEVRALDQAQTRALRGPRANPAAFLLVRPYLRTGVYVGMRGSGNPVPYWLISTRDPASLAAALTRARDGMRAEGPAVG